MQKFLVSLIVLFLSACLFENGYVGPEEKQSIETFHGLCKVRYPTIISPEKLLHLENPRISLVWSFIGISRSFNTSPSNTVVPEKPYRFKGDILQYPPEELVNSSEAAIGSFWLYNDMDGNDVMDDFFDPEHLVRLDSLKILQQSYDSNLQVFLKGAIVEEDPVDYRETVLIGGNGSLLAPSSSGFDTLFNPALYGFAEGIPISDMRSVLNERMKILSHLNKWEVFFHCRHRTARDEVQKLSDIGGGVTRDDMAYKRRVFPKPGKELLFEQELLKLTFEVVRAYQFATMIYRQSLKDGWIDYPYLDDGKKDWVAGRSIEYHVLYFATAKDLEQVKKSVKTSSFVVENLEQIDLGYQLLNCTDQYFCKILDWSDSIIIELGSVNEHFDPASSIIDLPIADIQSAVVGEMPDRDFAGVYEIQTFENISVWKQKAKLWIHYPAIGFLSLSPDQNGFFFSEIYQMQLSFYENKQGEMEKVLVFLPNFKTPGTRIPSPIQDSLNLEFQRLKSRHFESPGAFTADSLAGSYVFNSDTAVLSLAMDTLWASFPGLASFPVHLSGNWLGHPESGLEFKALITAGNKLTLFSRGWKGREISWEPVLQP